MTKTKTKIKKIYKSSHPQSTAVISKSIPKKKKTKKPKPKEKKKESRVRPILRRSTSRSRSRNRIILRTSRITRRFILCRCYVFMYHSIR